jgi:hypothetical protein
VEDLAVVIRDDQRTFTAEGATLELSQLGPGRQGSLGLRANLRLDQPSQVLPWLASVTLNADLDVNEAGTEVKWSGSNEFRVKERRADLAETESDAIRIDQTFAGEYRHAAQGVQASSRLTMSKGMEALGSAAVTVATTHSGSAQTVDASLTIDDVSGEALNIWLAGGGPSRRYSGLINGQVLVHAIGPSYEVRSQLAGRGIQMRSEGGTTSPLHFSLKQEASFDAQSRLLLLRTLDLALSHGTRSLLTGTLERPLKLLLGQDQAATALKNSEVGTEAVLTLKIQNIELADFRPWIALAGHDMADDVRADPLNGALNVSVDASGAVVCLDGHVRATNVWLESATRAARVGPLTVEHQVHARLRNLTRLELDPWTSVVKLKSMTVGELRATGSIHMTGDEPLALEGSLTLSDLPGETLNAVVAFWKPVRIRGARFRGHATWSLAEQRISWEADLRGRHVSLQPPRFSKATPPLDLTMAQSGSYDRTTGELRLVKFKAQAVDKGQVVVSTSLSHSVNLYLTRRENQASHQRIGNQPVTFMVQIDNLDIEQLKSRLVVMGINALEPVAGGLINGRLEARWQGSGDKTFVTGDLTATGLRLQRGTTQSPGPVSITARGNVTIEPDARIEWADCRLAVRAARQEIAAVQVVGLTDLGGGMTDLTVSASSGDLPMLLDRLALLEEEQRRLVVGGLLKLEGKAAGSGQGQPLSIQTSLHADNLRIKAGKTRSATYSIAARADLQIDGSRTEVEIKQMGMRMESDGRQPGSASVRGRWPLTSAGSQTGVTSVPGWSLKATLKDWDGGPFADLYQFLPGRIRGPLSINADLAVEQDGASGLVTIRGRTELGPIRVLRKGGGPEEGILQLDHDLSVGNEEVRASSMTLARKRPQGTEDQVSVSGFVRWGKQARTQVKGEVASLDTGWYEDLLAAPQDQADRPGALTGGVGKHPGDRRENYGFGALQDLHAEVKLGTVLYRGMMIGPGHLIAAGTGDRFTATLEPTELAHGKVQGELVITARDGEPEYRWSSKGDGLDVGVLNQANHPGSEATVTGTGSFTTNGTASGKGETLKRTASGTAAWDIVKGKFAKASLLAFISKHTGIKGLEDMTFDRMHGELRLSKGWILIDRVGVDGSLAKLDGAGKIGWDGVLDGRVSTRITPALADRVQIRCVTGLLRGADGLFALPVVVAVKGTVRAPEYHVEFTGEKAKSAAGSFSDLLRGCREDSSQPETTPAAAGQ